MHAARYPFTVRLVGFAPAECAQLEHLLAQAPRSGPSYFCLHDDSLQEPDLYLAAGDSPAALARLRCLPPGASQPTLVIGGQGASCYRTLPHPVDAAELYDALADLLDARVQTMAVSRARGVRSLPERRRRPRLRPDTAAPADYAQMRQGPHDGAVLIIDKGGAFRDHVAQVVGIKARPVEWTDSGRAALCLCDETAVSLVMINTAAPGIEPYDLCRRIKSQDGAGRTAVLFLVGQSFKYDSLRARDAGVRGLLDKPVADRHIVATFQKLLALPP
ncbi:two-component system response regulator [Massilia sp. H6]|uniref:response regulator n=1 Tax=Massilia sp. H6 TaxID=2970464 RepID=UPI0021676BC4|nr:response regulator [Massilia sp. H6]UVW28269.1 response regulator [Massilia sp. H6]